MKPKYKIENIRSISELTTIKGGRNLTPVFEGNPFPILVYITQKEFEKVRGNKQLMKELAIKKLNKKK